MVIVKFDICFKIATKDDHAIRTSVIQIINQAFATIMDMLGSAMNGGEVATTSQD